MYQRWTEIAKYKHDPLKKKKKKAMEDEAALKMCNRGTGCVREGRYNVVFLPRYQIKMPMFNGCYGDLSSRMGAGGGRVGLQNWDSRLFEFESE
jgi:hypothetical protein